MSGVVSVVAEVSDDVRARAAKVKVLAFDVDGVCTDGKLYYGADGCALHAFHARDGLGLVKARLAGITTVAISGRSSKNVEARLGELKVPYIRQGIAHKDRELQGILSELDVDASAVCYVGDDVNDVCVMDIVGLACAVADAEDDAKAHAHHVTQRAGGQGVLRELVELILRAQGRWKTD